MDEDFTDFSVSLEDGIIDVSFAKTNAMIDVDEIAGIAIRAGARDLSTHNNEEVSDVLDGYIEIVTKSCTYMYLPTDMINRPIEEVNAVAKEIKSFWRQHKAGKRDS